MSSQAVPILLVIYPFLTAVTPSLFFWLWPEMRMPAPTSLATATEDQKTKWGKVGARITLFTYGILIFGILAWLTFLSTGWDKGFFSSNKWLSNGLVGAYLGTSWAGVSIWVLALGASTGRMRREIPGIMSPLHVQIGVWSLGAFTEEAWRAIAIAALLHSGFSPVVSIATVSVAYGAAYLSLGLQRSAVAALDGVFFGFLYLWRGTFFAPLLAHLAVQAVYIWGVGELAFNRKTRKTWQIPGTKCPVCQTSLKLLQIKLGDVFSCPACKEQLSLSDTYQNMMRFAGAFVLVSVLFCSVFSLMIWLPLNIGICAVLSYVITLGFETSGFLLFQKTFVRLFPPRLQRGTPYFITMNLDPRQRTNAVENEQKSEED